MNLRERAIAIAASERSVIFTLGFLIGYPNFLYHDLCWQLAEGRTLWSGTFPRTLPEAFAAGPWIDHEWLFEAFAWPWWAHGWWPVAAAIFTAVAALVPVLAVAIARRCGASAFVANGAGYVTIVSAVTAYVPRPQTIAEACFALELLVLLGPPRMLWLVLPLTILWANVHGSVTLAPLLVAVVAAGRAIETRTLPPRAMLVAFGLAAAGTLATPSGIATWIEAASFEHRPELLVTFDWQPVTLGVLVNQIAAIGYGAILLTGGVPIARRNAVALLLLLVFAPIYLLHQRFLPFFGVAAVPALAIALGRSRLERRRRRRAAQAGPRGLWLALPLALAIAATAALRASESLRVEPELAATDALIRESGFSGRLFAPFIAGGYLQLRQAPVQVLLDTHALPFGAGVWSDYAAIDAVSAGWDGALERRRIRGVVALDASALATALRRTAGWRLAAQTKGYVLFVRGNAAGARRSAVTNAGPDALRLGARSRHDEFARDPVR